MFKARTYGEKVSLLVDDETFDAIHTRPFAARPSRGASTRSRVSNSLLQQVCFAHDEKSLICFSRCPSSLVRLFAYGGGVTVTAKRWRGTARNTQLHRGSKPPMYTWVWLTRTRTLRIAPMPLQLHGMLSWISSFFSMPPLSYERRRRSREQSRRSKV